MKYIPAPLVVAVAAFSLTLAACGPAEPELDLARVLDITVDTIVEIDGEAQNSSNPDADELYGKLAVNLGRNYSLAEPALYDTAIAVAPNADASLIAVADANNNQQADEDEDALWMIEIDGENSRIIATSKNGAVNDHGFSGTSLLAGFLIGSMLGRQRSAGVNTKALGAKKTRTAKQAAKSRAGSGSHAKGK